MRSALRHGAGKSWRRLAVLAVGGLALLAAGFFGGRYVGSRRYVGAAEQALRRHELDAARNHLRQALELQPRHAHALFLAAQVARRLDDYSQAEQLLAAFGEAGGDSSQHRLEWMLLGVQQGDVSEHEGQLQALIDSDHPQTSLILEALAKGYWNNLRITSMVRTLDLLLQRQPAHVPALVLRGRAKMTLGQREPALDDWRRAVELAPDLDAGRLSLAEHVGKLGYPREAIFHFETIVAERPDEPAALLGLARARFDHGELDGAEQVLDRLLTVEPDHVDALVERGKLAMRRRDQTLALRHFTRAATLAPWHREVHRLLGECLGAQGRDGEAQACFAKVADLEARDAELGRLSLRYKANPSDPAVRHQLGMWMMENGQPELGLRWLFTALWMEPRFGPTHAALADYFQRHGQPRRAEQHRALAEENGR